MHETGPASYGWNTVKNSNANAQFDIVRDDPRKAHAPVQGWIQRDLAVDLFKASGLDFEAQKKRAQTQGFTPVPLKGASFSADYAVDHSTIVSHNVLGKLPGTTHPDQTVFYTAHWDHLGVGQPDARGDAIYNGAVDNADGVASILELGRAFAPCAPHAAHRGVHGGDGGGEGAPGLRILRQPPALPAVQDGADINIDALATTGPARDISTSGNSALELQDMLAAYAGKDGRRFTRTRSRKRDTSSLRPLLVRQARRAGDLDRERDGPADGGRRGGQGVGRPSTRRTATTSPPTSGPRRWTSPAWRRIWT